jgi:AraC family transcriptional regulator
MELLAHTRIVMWEGASLWLVDATKAASPERRTDFHAHHAIQVTIGLGGWFKLGTASASEDGQAAIVAADVAHDFAAEGLVALLFVEPESRMGRAITRRLVKGAELAPIALGLVGDFRDRAAAAFHAPLRDDAALIELARTLVERLAGDGATDRPDLRVRKMIAWAAERLEGQVSLADVVEAGGLSAGRLRHLFVEQTGLPFKTYLLWLRLVRAVEVIAAGASLTQAAHAAGFSDSAHFSRTFRRMFGVAPVALRMT